jgi:DNA polymerase III delta prime subunit
MKSFHFHSLFLPALFCFLFSSLTIQAQQAQKPACDEERAILLAEKQVEEVSMLDQPPKQIAVMVRAADVLWSAQQSTARKIFTDAFALAEKLFKEKGDEFKREGRSVTLFPDQRFVVMRAIAKRDGAWAKQLAVRVAEETRKQAEQAAGEAKSQPEDNFKQNVQSKVLNLAITTAPIDKATAASLIRSTFAYPISSMLPNALFVLGDVSQEDANQLYQEALRAYANAPINEFLYLAAYPFVRDRIIGAEMYMNGWGMPKNVQPVPALQQQFIETLLRRGEAILKTPEQQTGGVYKLPEAAQLVIALTHLEAIAAQLQPVYVDRIAELKAYLQATLNTDMRQSLDNVQRQHDEVGTRMSGKGNSFATYSEQAERESNPEKREQAWAFAILNASDEISIDDLTGVARKVDDEKLRNQLLTFIYFKRTQKAIKDGQFVEALQLVKKIEQLDFRAYLAYEAAAAALKKEEEKLRAKEILEDVLELAYKAPGTNEKVRTLLGVAYLYAKLDKTRAFEVMSEAVKTINSLTNPDFSSPFIQQKIEGKQFSSYYGYGVEGFSLETVFRLLAPLDFDGALYRARSLDDRAQRGLAVLALAASCLEELDRIKKQDAEKKKRGKQPTAKPVETDSKKPQVQKPAQP